MLTVFPRAARGRPAVDGRSRKLSAAVTAGLLVAGSLFQGVAVAAPARADATAAQSLPVVTQDVSPLSAFDAELLRLTNVQRGIALLPALQETRGLDALTLWWSTQEANGVTGGLLKHNPDGLAMALTYGASLRTKWGEDAAKWTANTVTAQQVFDIYFASSTNKANLLSQTYKYIGIATVTTSSGVSFNTINFTDAADAGQTFDPRAAATPIGHYETATLSGATLRLQGWAIDPDITTAPSQIKVTDTAADGTVVMSTAAANTARPDVGAKYPKAGNSHGFDYSYVTATRGVHAVCVTVVNQGAGLGDVALGCLSFEVKNPVGVFDTATRSGTTLNLSGWAVDPDRPTTAATVTVIDTLGTVVTTTKLVADQVNSGVDTAFPGAGNNHAFVGTAIIGGAGDHTICASVVAVRSAVEVTQLGCKTITVLSSSKPVGTFYSAIRTGSTLAVSGWAVDREQLTAPVTVTIADTAANGATTTTAMVADQVSSTSSRAVPGAGIYHAFRGETQMVGAGSHSICVTAAAISVPSMVSNFGCRTVIFTPASPVGAFDTLVAPTRDTVTVAGWAADPDYATAANTIAVKITNAKGMTPSAGTVADGAYPTEVAPGLGRNHAFTGTFPLTSDGLNTVCVSSVSRSDPLLVTDLGCKSVTANWLLGNLDKVTPAITAVGVRTLTIEGWAADGGNLTATLTVRIAITAPGGTVTSSTTTANTSRPDVGRAIPGAGDNHGYVTTVPITGGGSYQVCVTALSSRDSTMTRQFTCNKVTVS